MTEKRCPECHEVDVELVSTRERRGKAPRGEQGPIVAVTRWLKCRFCGCSWPETVPAKQP